MSFENVSIAPQAPLPPQGSNAKSTVNKVADQPAVRNIPTIKDYNMETGGEDDRGPWKTDGKAKSTAPDKKSEKKSAKKQEASTSETTETKSAHQSWQEKQQAKKEAREQAKYEKQAQRQALAKDYLQQGNIFKAAESLGVSVPELLALTQNAALSIPTEKKEMSADEKKAQEESQYRQTLEARLKAAEEYRFENTVKEWTRENITPVIADKERYQLLNLNPDAVPKFQRAVYDFLNEHFKSTCEYNSKGELVKQGEVLSVADVLDTLEAQMEEAAKSSVNKFKQVKKFSSLFEARQAEEEQAQQEEEVVEEETPTEELQLGEQPSESEEEEEFYKTPINVTAGARKNVPFALMSPEEKVAFLNSKRSSKRK